MLCDGSAGSKEKVNWLVNNAGIDYAFNYKELKDQNISTELRSMLANFFRRRRRN
jgi:NADPH-dependent curcumin reductase CurA